MSSSIRESPTRTGFRSTSCAADTARSSRSPRRSRPNASFARTPISPRFRDLRRACQASRFWAVDTSVSSRESCRRSGEQRRLSPAVLSGTRPARPGNRAGANVADVAVPEGSRRFRSSSTWSSPVASSRNTARPTSWSPTMSSRTCPTCMASSRRCEACRPRGPRRDRGAVSSAVRRRCGVRHDLPRAPLLLQRQLTAAGSAGARPTVRQVERLDVHGGSLRIHASTTGAADPSVDRLIAEESSWGVDDAGRFERFATAVDALRDEVHDLVARLVESGATLGAYGAAAKGVVLANVCKLDAELVSFVVDRNPHKQGRLLPGVGIPILPPVALHEEQPDYCLLFAWNLAAEIAEQQAAYVAPAAGSPRPSQPPASSQHDLPRNLSGGRVHRRADSVQTTSAGSSRARSVQLCSRDKARGHRRRVQRRVQPPPRDAARPSLSACSTRGGKAIRCTRGSVYDVAVDLRPRSRTHLRWTAVELRPTTSSPSTSTPAAPMAISRSPTIRSSSTRSPSSTSPGLQQACAGTIRRSASSGPPNRT